MADRKDAIHQARKLLDDLDYLLVSHQVLTEGGEKVGEQWTYSDGAELCIVRGVWEDGEFISFDVFVPITDSPKVEDVLAAIRERAGDE